MRLMLDTNIILWYILEDIKLPIDFKQMIMDEKNQVFFSMVSLWEIGIKQSIGKLKLEGQISSLFSDIENIRSFSPIGMRPEHILKSSSLPFHHRDPFDRLIWAQSLCEETTLLYTDKIFDKYKNA